MIPLSARDLRYLGKADLDEGERVAYVKEMHELMRKHFFREGFKDAPIYRVEVDGKYDPNKDYSQDYTRRRKKTVSE